MKKGVVVIGKLEIGGRIYDATLDDNGETTHLSFYDKKHKISVTLCFDNTSNGRASDELLKNLKNIYLNSLSV